MTSRWDYGLEEALGVEPFPGFFRWWWRTKPVNMVLTLTSGVVAVAAFIWAWLL